jgi:hypothetical protein
LRNKRQLLDAYGSPLLHMERKMISLHDTWLLVRPSDGARIAELKPALMSLTPCKSLKHVRASDSVFLIMTQTLLNLFGKRDDGVIACCKGMAYSCCGSLP